MVSRMLKRYELQVYRSIEDEFGYPIDIWETIAPIKVAINESYMNTSDGQGTVYQKRVIQATTPFKKLSIQPYGSLDGSRYLDGTTILIDKAKKYRLLGQHDVYTIEDFIKGRMTQLQLKEVV